MARTGRPKIDNPADVQFRIRLTKDDYKLLDNCAEILNTTKSDVIRKGIELVHQGLKKD